VLVTAEFPEIRKLQILGKKIASHYGGGRFGKKERSLGISMVLVIGSFSLNKKRIKAFS